MKPRMMVLLGLLFFLLGYLSGSIRVLALINSGAVKVPCIEEKK